MDNKNLISGPGAMKFLHYKTSINKETNFGPLDKATIKIPNLAACLIHRGVRNYDNLKGVVIDYDRILKDL